jgi:hypothetical protein
LGVRSEPALQWSGDIIAQDKPPDPLFSQEYRLDKFDRALLGAIRSTVNWIPAFYALVDYYEAWSKANSSQWLDDLVKWDPVSLTARVRTTMSRLFTTFSKVVHQELLLPPEESVDRATLVAAIGETVRYCATIALLTHFDQSVLGGMAPAQALRRFVSCEGGT